MGLQIGEIVPRKAIELIDLKNKVICVDAFNTLFQFLSTIRQPDGTPLMDKKKRITSHLSGLFYRNINLLMNNIKLIYVFDGKPPRLKAGTQRKRETVKQEAKQKYETAKRKEDIEGMGKYARQLSILSDEMIAESKKLLEYMGIAVVQAPSEGEAQAAYLAKRYAYGVASQDYDALLFGAPRLIQNLTLAKKRRTLSGYVFISPEIIELENLLNGLQINMDQLICLGILAGTDYNPGGIYGIGQKKALQLVRQYKQPALIFRAVEDKLSSQENKFDWQEIFELFHKPHIKKEADIEFPEMKEDKIKDMLIEYDFSETRINNQLEKLDEKREKAKQKDLKSFL